MTANFDRAAFRTSAEAMLALCSDEEFGEIGAAWFAEKYRRTRDEETSFILRQYAAQQSVPDDLPENVIPFRPRMA